MTEMSGKWGFVLGYAAGGSLVIGLASIEDVPWAGILFLVVWFVCQWIAIFLDRATPTQDTPGRKEP